MARPSTGTTDTNMIDPCSLETQLVMNPGDLIQFGYNGIASNQNCYTP